MITIQSVWGENVGKLQYLSSSSWDISLSKTANVTEDESQRTVGKSQFTDFNNSLWQYNHTQNDLISFWDLQVFLFLMNTDELNECLRSFETCSSKNSCSKYSANQDEMYLLTVLRPWLSLTIMITTTRTSVLRYVQPLAFYSLTEKKLVIFLRLMFVLVRNV